MDEYFGKLFDLHDIKKDGVVTTTPSYRGFRLLKRPHERSQFYLVLNGIIGSGVLQPLQWFQVKFILVLVIVRCLKVLINLLLYLLKLVVYEISKNSSSLSWG